MVALTSIQRAVLLVEREGPGRLQLEQGLSRHGFDVSSAGRLDVARQRLTRVSFPLVVLGTDFPDGSGLGFLEELRVGETSPRVLVLGEEADERTATESRRLGACDYLYKPVDADDLAQRAERVIRLLGAHDASVPSVATAPAYLTPTRSEKVRTLYKLIDLYCQAAPTPVLILGETGVGKERVARALHARSPRANRPFVALNCATFDTPLFESELFGHERGSFTGAQQRKAGLMELAGGGTLFLDEIGEMPLPAQAKLLRAIETHSFRRVGGTQEIRSAFWLVAATNRTPETLLATHRFRADLYYRIATLLIEVPPLRERLCDLGLLVRELCSEFLGLDEEVPFDPDLLDALASHDWPGNIRELRNLIERELILRKDPSIQTRTDFRPGWPKSAGTAAAPLQRVPPGGAQVPEPMTLREIEREAVRRTLARCQGNKSATARALGIPRSTLKRMLHRYELDG